MSLKKVFFYFGISLENYWRFLKNCKLHYRTRSNNGRSWLVAAPLRSHAKTHFYVFFMWQSEDQNKNFWIVGVPFIGAGTVIYYCGRGILW